MAKIKQILFALLTASIPWLLLATPSHAVMGPGETCDAVAFSAAHHANVPIAILKAISRTETGRQIDGKLVPWPWALNVEGRGYWFDTRHEAWAFASAQIQKGIRSIDFGCFQVNLRWHGRHFTSVSSIFDPQTNADYAATFLRGLYEKHGSWIEAVAAYHSLTPEFARAYLDRFLPIYNDVKRESMPLLYARRQTVLGNPLNPSPKQTHTHNSGSLFPSSRSLAAPFIRQ